jgi:hypothetical protein
MNVRQRLKVRGERDKFINGWHQKGAGDLLGEAVIAITLSGLAEEADAAGDLYCTKQIAAEMH